jgi:ribosomal protein L29
MKGRFAMRSIEAKLAEWHELYKKLGAARQQLATAAAQPSTGWQLSQLEKEVARLKTSSDAALDEVHVLLARRSVRDSASTGDSDCKARLEGLTPMKSVWGRRVNALQQAASRWAGG